MITFKYKTNGGCAFPVGYKQNLGLHSAKDRGGVKEVAIDTCVYHLMCTTVCTVQSLLDIYIYGLLYNVTVSSLWPLHQQALVAVVSF